MFCVSCAPVQANDKVYSEPKPQQKPSIQAFLVKRSLGVSSAKELDGASVCLIKGSKEEKLVSDYFKKNGMAYEVVTGEDKNELTPAYKAGRCDVMVIFSNANINKGHKFLPLE